MGFALSEGIVDRLAEIESVEALEIADGIEARLWVSDARAEALGERRRAMLGPVGCGLCGIDSLAQAMRMCRWCRMAHGSTWPRSRGRATRSAPISRSTT
jgi:formate dehydrogenase assembly factor FdhD